jgi:hypothetical protein
MRRLDLWAHNLPTLRREREGWGTRNNLGTQYASVMDVLSRLGKSGDASSDKAVMVAQAPATIRDSIWAFQSKTPRSAKSRTGEGGNSRTRSRYSASFSQATKERPSAQSRAICRRMFCRGESKFTLPI